MSLILVPQQSTNTSRDPYNSTGVITQVNQLPEPGQEGHGGGEEADQTARVRSQQRHGDIKQVHRREVP